MNSVCPSSWFGTGSPYGSLAKQIFTTTNPENTTAVGTLLSGNTVRRVPGFTVTTDPEVDVRGTKYQTKLFSVTSIVDQKVIGRYPTSSVGYLTPRSPLTTSELDDIYAYFINTNIPNKTPARKIILPTPTSGSSASLTGNLSGNVVDAVESVSYDLLYSFKYEFCYYAQMFSILMNDYIFIQNKPTSATFTSDFKNELIRELVNQMVVVRTRINDITAIAAAVGNKQTSELSTLNNEINSFLNSTKGSVQTLNENALVLLGKDKESNLRSRQLGFSEEKNAYANQLLAMYGFANLIALGLLFYIYKS